MNSGNFGSLNFFGFLPIFFFQYTKENLKSQILESS